MNNSYTWKVQAVIFTHTVPLNEKEIPVPNIVSAPELVNNTVFFQRSMRYYWVYQILIARAQTLVAKSETVVVMLLTLEISILFSMS